MISRWEKNASKMYKKIKTRKQNNSKSMKNDKCVEEEE